MPELKFIHSVVVEKFFVRQETKVGSEKENRHVYQTPPDLLRAHREDDDDNNNDDDDVNTGF